MTLVVILDPLGGVPVFLTLTSGHETRLRNRAAYQAIAVATAVIVVFAVFGQLIIEYLGISLESLMVAGGVLLFIVALEMLRGGGDMLTVSHEEANVAFVPLGTPLLAGPGAIVATMVLMRQNPDFGGKVSVILGVLIALAAVLASLRFASWCSRYLRPSAIHFLTRILGILLTAIAVQLVVSAVARWSRLGLEL
ncbi:MAG: MarC family protein [Actinomycetota bacterium]|nr:MarC family protein [Actinomycetota bacterium]